MTSLVLPAYNPGPAIERAYLAVRDFVRRRRRPWEALFVLDGCTDDTPARLRDLLARAPTRRIRVLAYEENRGKGHALRVGLLAARGSRRIFTDVDLAYGFRDVLRVDRALRRGASVAVGSREHPASEVRLPSRMLPYAFCRRLQSVCFAAAARTLLGVRQPDTQAGLKGMTAAVAKRVLPRMACDGFGFDCELLTACSRLRIEVAEVPVAVRVDGRQTTTSWRTSASMLGEILSIRRRWGRVSPAPRLEVARPRRPAQQPSAQVQR